MYFDNGTSRERKRLKYTTLNHAGRNFYYNLLPPIPFTRVEIVLITRIVLIEAYI